MEHGDDADDAQTGSAHVRRDRPVVTFETNGEETVENAERQYYRNLMNNLFSNLFYLSFGLWRKMGDFRMKNVKLYETRNVIAKVQLTS